MTKERKFYIYWTRCRVCGRVNDWVFLEYEDERTKQFFFNELQEYKERACLRRCECSGQETLQDVIKVTLHPITLNEYDKENAGPKSWKTRRLLRSDIFDFITSNEWSKKELIQIMDFLKHFKQ